MNIGKFLFMIAALSILAAACAARAEEPFVGQDDFAAAPQAMESEGISSDTANRFALQEESGAVEPLVIRNANLSLVVEDPAESADEIAKMAEELGGFVVSSNVFQSSSESSARTVLRASVSVRVPVEHLDEALDRIQENALEVQEKRITGEDVTKQYTDLQSKLRNLEATEEQLLVIMEEARETEDVLRVFENLRQVREQIELIKGQMNYFEDSARLSLISVDLIPDELAQPLQIGGWRPEGTAKQAVETLIQTLQFLADAGIWLVICVLPIGLLLGIPGYFIGRKVIQRRRPKGDVSKPNVEPKAEG